MKKHFHLFKKTDPGSYPCRNKSFADLPGEKWKYIPDFEDSYMVSDFGRIKSMARTIYCIDGRCVHTKEKIMSPVLGSAPNYYIGDFTSHLFVSLRKDKKSYCFSVRRLVYHCFVSPIDLNGQTFYILCKDGNGLNTHYRNLQKATHSQKQSRIFERERATTCFITSPEIGESARLERERQVTQYDLQGKKINVYPNIKAAAIAAGINTSNISVVLKGSHLSAGKYIWRYGDGPEEIDLTGYWEQGKLRGAAKLWKKVTQYNLQGERVAIYASLKEASQTTGIEGSLISRSLSGRSNGAKGFVWKAGEGRKKIGIAKLMNGDKLYGTSKKRVAQYTMEGTLLAVYNSIREAAQAVDVDSSAISQVVRGINAQSAGYRWKYAGKKLQHHQNAQSASHENIFTEATIKRTKTVKKLSIQGLPLFPYQNKSLTDMEGELWKEIPGLDGVYLISNSGRIKALSRYIESTAAKGFWSKERIMAQAVTIKKPNGNTKESARHLNITIRYENHPYSIVVSRMVYHLFVEEINIKGSEDFIKYKDGNGLNCRSSNLMKVTRSEHNKICFERGQMIPSYNIDPSRYKNFHFAGSPDRKIICQYNHKGELLNTYASQKAVSEATGIMDSTICMALKRKFKTAGGYIWRYEGELFATKKERKEIAIHHGTGKIVTQYDMKGNKIGVYFSLKEAELATGADTAQILRSTKFKHLSAKGFFWRAGEGEETIDVAYYWKRITKKLQSCSRPVEQYDSEGKLMNTYASIKEAMRKTGINDTAIARALKSKRTTKDGSIWKLNG